MSNEKQPANRERPLTKTQRLELIIGSDRKLKSGELKPARIRKPLPLKPSFGVSVKTQGSARRGYRTEVYVDRPELLSAYGMNITLNIGGDYKQ